MSGTGSRSAAVLRTAANLWVLTLAPTAWGQSVRDVPPIDRQADDFYHAVSAGGPVTTTWAAAPPTAPLGGDITLTLTVRGAANPAELVRPDLRKRPEFADRFQVTDGPPAAPGSFAYRLRPRAVGETAVPPLRYRYYQPRYPEGKRMQTTFARSLPITVTPPAAPASPPVPLDAPDEFFAPPAAGWSPPPAVVWMPVALAPVAAVGWFLVWRTWFPDAARRAVLRRDRAARTALARLAAARRSADPAAAAALAVRDFLAARYGVPSSADTPAAVAAAWPHPATGDVVEFLRACDAARFAADRDTGLSLVTRAEKLVAGNAA
jgi:hypothetical protein